MYVKGGIAEMQKINQGDILSYAFSFFKERYGKTQLDFAAALGYIAGDHPPVSHLSEAMSSKRNSYPRLSDKGEKIYAEIFAPYFEKHPEQSEHELERLKYWLADQGLYFDGQKDAENKGFEGYVKAMMLEGLPRYEGRDKKKHTPALCGQSFSGIPHFVGRTEDMKILEETLRQNNAAVIHGMPGIGKSALAEEFAAHALKKGMYSRVQRVVFSNGKFSEASFTDLLCALKFDGLQISDSDSCRNIDTVFDALRRSSGKSLIIIDGLDLLADDTDVFERFRHYSGADFIITTRRNDFLSDTSFVMRRLSALSRVELISLVVSVMGYELSGTETSRLYDLFELGGNNTFFVRLAAESMKEFEMSAAEIIRLLKSPYTANDDALPDLSYRFITEDGYIHANMREILRKVLFRYELTEAQRRILYILSFMPAEGISRILLMRFLDNKERVSVTELQDCGLVERVIRNGRPMTVVNPEIARIMVYEYDDMYFDGADIFNNNAYRLHSVLSSGAEEYTCGDLLDFVGGWLKFSLKVMPNGCYGDQCIPYREIYEFIQNYGCEERKNICLMLAKAANSDCDELEDEFRRLAMDGELQEKIA